MKVILLSSFDFERLESRITFIRYPQNQKTGKQNNLHQVHSKSKDWKAE
jgi:hypothetical protein